MHEIPDFPEACEPAIQPKRNFGLLLIRASFSDKTYVFSRILQSWRAPKREFLEYNFTLT